MSSHPKGNPVAITGVGVATAAGCGVQAFAEALFSGRAKFALLQRPGRETPLPIVGAEIDDAAFGPTRFAAADRLAKRSGSLVAQTAIQVLAEAWRDARLDGGRVPAARIGLVVGGLGHEPRADECLRGQYRGNLRFIRPSSAVATWDTHLIGLLSEAFGIQGECVSVGGASAAGAVAVIHAARQIASGATDVSIAVGALCDLSQFELQALRNLGALGGEQSTDHPDRACRPFDVSSDGFIPGEGCAAIVLERDCDALSGHVNLRGWFLGGCIASAAEHGPAPNPDAQRRVMCGALEQAGVVASDVDYVSTHGTGAPLGDATEVATIRAAGLDGAWINATKSITGHCLTASGAIEVVATVLQMQAGRCHATRNLVQPIDPALRWVRQQAVEADINIAISNSFAFGGINTSLVLGRLRNPQVPPGVIP